MRGKKKKTNKQNADADAISPIQTQLRYVKGFLVWMEDVPPHLYYVLLTDNNWFSVNEIPRFYSQKEKKKSR